MIRIRGQLEELRLFSREVELIVLSIALALLFSLSLLSTALAVPDGADNATTVNSTRRAPGSPAQLAAVAGNVTELVISGYTVTQSWQGYYGNVTGTITLEDSGGNVLYNWTATNPNGEIYASNKTVLWTSIQCFNFTATGTMNLSADVSNGGGYSLSGLNLSGLHQLYSINNTNPPVDSVNITFFETNVHQMFFTGPFQFDSAECPTAYMHDNSGAKTAGSFEEVLLWDPLTNQTVFASLLEDNLLGFDQRSHDFEMIVLEDGHGTDTANTLYYFYVEIE
ncbi:hypothetical protein HY501_02545 [Candidatus Woesearchaeota archaeon]|nr:hypothetical protein [Candidatus Woesearchaeota archaeon]